MTLLRSITFLSAFILLFLSCGREGRKITSDDEERIFSLVADPSAEGDYTTALRRADSLLDNVEMGDTLRAYIMIERNTALINSGDYRHTIGSADSLIDFGCRYRIDDAVAQGLQNKGVALRRMNDYDGAIACYEEGLQFTTSTGDSENGQVFAECLAVLYLDMGRMDEGRRFAEKSLELAETIADSTAIVSAASTLGSAVSYQGKYAEAVEMMRPYRTAALEAHPLYLVKYLTPLITAYIQLDSLPQAERDIELLSEAAAPYGHSHQSHTVALRAKAQLAGAKGDYSRQYAIYQELDTLPSHGRRPNVRLLDRALCLHKMGRHDEAFAMLEQSYHNLDSTSKSELQERLSALSARYGVLEKDLEIEQLRNHRLFLTGIISLCVMVVITGILLIIGARRRVRSRMEREKQTSYLAGLEQERSRMAYELHDNIAGEITGLRLQIDSLSRAQTSERLQEISNDVRSISHRLMPPEFRHYTFTQLLTGYVQDLRRTYPQIKTTLTDEGSFDWNSLSARDSHEMYRIIQECVHNAMRHAIPTEISITLGGEPGHFILSIENNGVTSDCKTQPDAHRTLKARAALIGAAVVTETTAHTYKQTISTK